jgi:hypothetical protein
MEQDMFGKVGLAALAMIPVFSATHTGDLRDLYNQMYPLNALTRDAFNLCHESDATFVRALQTDREQCLDHMPHSIAIAIGRVPADSDLLAWAPISEGARAALRLAQSPAAAPHHAVEAPRQLAAFADLRGMTREAPRAALDRVAESARALDDAAFAQLVLAQPGAAAVPHPAPLPLLSPGPPPAEPEAALPAASSQASVGAAANGA